MLIRVRIVFALGVATAVVAAQPGRAAHIVSISVGNEHPVAVPAALTTLSDEHSTIWSPDAPGNHSGQYLVFAASRVNEIDISNNESGQVVLSSAGPDSNGKWAFNFTGNYGSYLFPITSTLTLFEYAQNFLSGMAHLRCPATADPTFDLNYAAPATVLFDPSIPSNKNNLLMIYEGTNRCIGIPGGSNVGERAFSTIGVATSYDDGVIWPAYLSNSVSLPGLNQTSGPQSAFGASWPNVCNGDRCKISQPTYFFGRYAVLTPPVTVATAMSFPGELAPNNMGDSQPSAFIDDVAGNAYPYVYVIYNELPGSYTKAPFPDLNEGMSVARAQLNGGRGPLSFTKWAAGSFDPVTICTATAGGGSPVCEYNAGLGGSGGGLGSALSWSTANLSKTQIYQACLDTSQKIQMGSISYVEDTNEYLLTFVCLSKTDPMSGRPSGTQAGAAWFFSTIDASSGSLEAQNWSTPREISGSWNTFAEPDKGNCENYFNGWYPSFMSEYKKPSHLVSTGGWAFYMQGCTNTTLSRRYMSRHFTMTTH